MKNIIEYGGKNVASVAAKCNLSVGAIRSAIKGADIRLSTILAITRGLGVTLEELIDPDWERLWSTNHLNAIKNKNMDDAQEILATCMKHDSWFLRCVELRRLTFHDFGICNAILDRWQNG